jgi:hypothetical protein
MAMGRPASGKNPLARTTMNFILLNPAGADASGAVIRAGYLLSKGVRSMLEKKWLLKR